jgi:hypothetical protein
MNPYVFPFFPGALGPSQPKVRRRRHRCSQAKATGVEGARGETWLGPGRPGGPGLVPELGTWSDVLW